MSLYDLIFCIHYYGSCVMINDQYFFCCLMSSFHHPEVVFNGLYIAGETKIYY